MIVFDGSGSHPRFLDSCVRSRRHHRRCLAGGNVVVCLRRICTSGLILAYWQFYLDGDGDGIGIIADRLSTPTYCRAQALQCSLTNRSVYVLVDRSKTILLLCCIFQHIGPPVSGTSSRVTCHPYHDVVWRANYHSCPNILFAPVAAHAVSFSLPPYVMPV